MERSWWTRLIIIIAVTLGVAWLLVPSYYSFFVLDPKSRNDVKLLAEKLPRWAPPARYRISLGLDLQGGIHMVMKVDTKTALIKRTERRGQAIVNWVKEKKLGDVTLTAAAEDMELTLTAKDPGTMDAIERDVLATFEDFSKVGRDGANLKLRLKESYVQFFEEDSVNQAMLVIRKRIDKWGVAEVDVRKIGTDSIQVSLPGQQNPEAREEADRHHRPARVPHGGPEQLLRRAAHQGPARRRLGRAVPQAGREDRIRRAGRVRQLPAALLDRREEAARLPEGQGPRESRDPAPLRQLGVEEAGVRPLHHLPGGQGGAAHRRDAHLGARRGRAPRTTRSR